MVREESWEEANKTHCNFDCNFFYFYGLYSQDSLYWLLSRFVLLARFIYGPCYRFQLIFSFCLFLHFSLLLSFSPFLLLSFAPSLFRSTASRSTAPRSLSSSLFSPIHTISPVSFCLFLYTFGIYTASHFYFY